MTTATHSGFEPPFAGRMIPVSELLNRERPGSAVPDSQARRTLGGVAAGAVLAFSAVVGGFLLHHPHESGALSGDATGGLDVSSDSGTPGLAAAAQAVPGPAAPGVVSGVGSGAQSGNSVPVSQLGNSAAFVSSGGAGTAVLPQSPAALPERLSGTLPTPSAPASPAASAPATTTSTPTTDTSTAQPATVTQTQAPAAKPTPGLVGTVTGVVNDVLPFHWFN